MRRSILLLCLASGALAAGLYAGDRWTIPEQTAVVPEIPRLRRPLVMDGNLTEWSGALCVPMRNRAAIIRERHAWRGLDDAGLEMYAGWNQDGLCLAAVVSDNEICNDRDGDATYLRDCVELFVNRRPAGSAAAVAYDAGSRQIFLRPPTDARGAALVVHSSGGAIDGLKAAARRTDTGYTAEMFIPWESVARPKAGDYIGLHFFLGDYDRLDGDRGQPLVMSLLGRKNPRFGSDRLLAWKLVEELTYGANTDLELQVELDVPAVIYEAGTFSCAADAGRLLSSRCGAIRVELAGPDGKKTAEWSGPSSALDRPWQDSRGVRGELKAGMTPDGVGRIRVCVLDRAGRPLGAVSRPVLCVIAVREDMLARFARADIARLVQSEPFRAGAWLGAAASLERLKRAGEKRNVTEAGRVVRETLCRLDVLDGVAAETPGLCDLLRLTANPEAQVVVEYPVGGRSGTVTFYCGAVPLAGVRVKDFARPEDLAAELDRENKYLHPVVENITLDGCPGHVDRHTFYFTPFAAADFNPASQVFVRMNAYNDVLDVENLRFLTADAAVIMPDCPDKVYREVESWADFQNVPIVDLEEAVQKPCFLVAGNICAAEAAPKLQITRLSRIVVTTHPSNLKVAKDTRLYHIEEFPDQIAAEQALKLVLAGKPVTPAETDSLRRRIVDALMVKGASADRPEGTRFFCGDVHLHTTCSDGQTTPPALALESLYCNMDFAVMSDHDTIDGARLARGLLRNYGFAYELIVGEEVTNTWVHFNAYPLKEVIPPELSASEIIRAAHRQGAVIQWNHPDWFWTSGEWAWANYGSRLVGTGLDAWEHYSSDYELWRKTGALPVLTGSTDTHDGTFDCPERTIVFAPSPSGEDLAEAIRRGNAVMVTSSGPHFFYGSDRMTALAWKALADGRGLRDATAERYRSVLKKADVVGFLKRKK